MRRLSTSFLGVRSHLARIALLLAVVAPGWAPAAEPPPPQDTVIEDCIRAVALEEDQRVYDAVSRIDGIGRRLLALRSYLRGRAHLAERWSWTQAQIAAYEGSTEHQALQAEIERVREVFARDNPGFELWVNPQVRSLDRQIEVWNRNESVAVASENLFVALRAVMPEVKSPGFGDEQSKAALVKLLIAYMPKSRPSVAAPGLSPHGQMRAIDFQVYQGGEVVAGPRIATIETDWIQSGWSARLDAAVHAASDRFVGPLARPREPWHYIYMPEAVTAQ